eukprot:gnl/TRDRNA2_/TRDRNA2_195379_c0_seq1.p2 gnl/TRDRNA2_/TRDRNA2_195379_c0~~gnl/TRDRNA2_/TRDRNA2_195379_c0_seq1.p2  ORF type:complete len:111 (-),score=25.10 gnl/TRDRNA2_/TRDRNA2_195379_c0_seq1:85-417(-)
MGGMMGMGGMGMSQEAIFFNNLQQFTGMAGQMSSQVMVLLPVNLLTNALVPHGHLGDIAQKCNVRIDLGAEVPPNMRQVSIQGTLVANTMVVYFLQERAMQYSSMAGSQM